MTWIKSLLDDSWVNLDNVPKIEINRCGPITYPIYEIRAIYSNYSTVLLHTTDSLSIAKDWVTLLLTQPAVLFPNT